MSKWERSSFFKLFHHETGRNVVEFDAADQIAVEAVIGFDIGDAGADQVVEIAGHAVGAKNFGHIAGGGGKTVEPIGGVAVGADHHEDGQAKADGVGVKQSDAGADDAAILIGFDAAPHGVARQADVFTDIFKRQVGVTLQKREQAAVEVVKFLHHFS